VLISVPAGRFVAVASLSRRASWGRPMSRFTALQGLGPKWCWSRRRYHRMWWF